jgi:site-specific recombinase XerD
MSTDSFPRVLHRFFGHVQSERNLSGHTICAYRDTFRLLLRFLHTHHKVSIDRIAFEHLTAESVLSFLEHLQSDRHNAIRTRNARLAAVRAFVQFALGYADPQFLLEGQRILKIPVKRTVKPVLGCMDRREIDGILAAPDPATRIGRRDHLLFTLLYNTGGRISEILRLKPNEVHHRIVHLHGKGRKERDVPIWPQVQQEIKTWCADNQIPGDQYIFASENGAPLSRRGAALRLKQAVRRAAGRCPSLQKHKVSLHTFRHSTALHLLQAGVALEVIALWMGHEQPITTHGYIEADIQMKRKSLRKLQTPLPARKVRRQGSHLLSFLEAL